MRSEYYGGYLKLGDILERYLIYDFDQKLIDFLIDECSQFLVSKNIPEDTLKHFGMEMEIKGDQSYVGIKGINLMSALWVINVYPPFPEKFIQENLCIYDGKKYIYDPRVKSLKITNYAGETGGCKSDY